MADVPQNLLQQIKDFEEQFTVDRSTLKKIVDHFIKELEKGMYPAISAPNSAREASPTNPVPSSHQVSVSRVVTS